MMRLGKLALVVCGTSGLGFKPPPPPDFDWADSGPPTLAALIEVDPPLADESSDAGATPTACAAVFISFTAAVDPCRPRGFGNEPCRLGVGRLVDSSDGDRSDAPLACR